MQSLKLRTATAFAGAISAAAASTAVGGVLQAGDPTECISPDSLLAGHFQEGELFGDATGDCCVGDIDIVLNILSQEIPIEDHDLDGTISINDQIETVRRIIARSFGDLDADGVVGEADILHVVIAMKLKNDHTADVTFDGVVNADDLLAIIGKVGKPMRADAERLAPQVVDLMNYLMQHDYQVLLGSCGGGGPTAGSHSQSISGSYPDSHGSGFSGWFPDDHMHTITSDWPTLPPGHNGAISSGTHYINFSQHTWPANHSYSVSSDWGTDPGDHSSALSEEWEYQPDHRTDASTSWPSPSDHDNSISRTYPPNHSGSRSAQRHPTEHRADTSGNWHNGSTSQNNHGSAFSSKWPTNHTASVSASWPGNSHHGGTSARWPTNHHSAASTTWPANTNPQWPPTHFSAVSSDWGQPADDGWPLFPPDHSWWTTGTDIYDLFP